jgi:hypothetical protein
MAYAPSGWSQPKPPKPPTGGFGLYGPQAPGTTGPKYKPPRQPHPKARAVKVPKAPTRPVPRTYVDPFAPTSDAELQARAGGIGQQQLAALIDQIRQAIEGRSRSGTAAIGSLTNQLGGLMSGVGPASQKIYDTARVSGSQINDALANRLGQFGQGLAAEQAGKFALQGAPAGVAGQIAGGTQQTAQGAANAGFARGSAGTEMLNTQGAAAGAYGAALPGIAGLTGIQNERNLQAQLSKAFADQVGAAQGQSQTTIANIYMHLLDQELSKAVAKQSGLINQEKINATNYNKNAALTYKKQNDARNAKLKAQSLGISQQRVNETMRHNGMSETQAIKSLIAQNQRATQTQRQQNLRQNKWQTNPNGTFKTRLNKKTGKQERIPIAKPKSSSSGGHFAMVNGKMTWVP